MSARFGQIFWGLTIVVIDIRFNGFDVVADVAGYALIAVGAAGLASLSAQFRTASSLSMLLGVAWLVGLFLTSDVAMMFGILTEAVVNSLLIWTLLGGILELALSQERADLSDRASNRRLAYVILIALATIFGLAAPYSGGVLGPLVVVLAVGVLVVMAMILHLIYRTRHELATPTPVAT